MVSCLVTLMLHFDCSWRGATPKRKGRLLTVVKRRDLRRQKSLKNQRRVRKRKVRKIIRREDTMRIMNLVPHLNAADITEISQKNKNGNHHNRIILV